MQSGKGFAAHGVRHGVTGRSRGSRASRRSGGGTATDTEDGGQRQIEIGSNVAEWTSPDSLQFAFGVDLVVGHGQVEVDGIHCRLIVHSMTGSGRRRGDGTATNSLAAVRGWWWWWWRLRLLIEEEDDRGLLFAAINVMVHMVQHFIPILQEIVCAVELTLKEPNDIEIAVRERLGIGAQNGTQHNAAFVSDHEPNEVAEVELGVGVRREVEVDGLFTNMLDHRQRVGIQLLLDLAQIADQSGHLRIELLGDAPQ